MLKCHCGMLMYILYTYSIYTLLVLVLILVMRMKMKMLVFILCKSLTKKKSCKLALCYMSHVHGIGCLTMPSALSLINKQTNKTNKKSSSLMMVLIRVSQKMSIFDSLILTLSIHLEYLINDGKMCVHDSRGQMWAHPGAEMPNKTFGTWL